MEFFTTIAKRHSYRGSFADEPVLREHLISIVQAGLLAPSGLNGQTTEFVIVDDHAIMQEIHKLHPKNKAMQQAKAFIACLFDVTPKPIYENCSFQVEDCSAAVQNMLLAITDLNYASVWVDGWLRLNNHAQILGELLNIPENKIIRVILPIGVPTKPVLSKVQKKPFAERAWFNAYGGQPSE